MKKITLTFFLTFLFSFPLLVSQTIAEKKAGSSYGGTDLSQEMQRFLLQVNKELNESHAELQRLYDQAQELYNNKASESEYQSLLVRINAVKRSIETLENSWREVAIQGFAEENYALWHQPEATIGLLVMDYGSQDYIYLLNPEIASIKLSVDSNLPIPRASWSEMLELILSQNGIGIRQLNPYLRQLYFIDEDKTHLKLITNNRKDLEVLPAETRVCFVLSPEPEDVRRIWLFLEKFVNPNTTVMQKVGRDILIIAQVGEVQDLLKLYDFVSSNRGDKEYKVIALRRVDAVEMASILGAIFDQMSPPQNERGQERHPSPERNDRQGMRQDPKQRTPQPRFNDRQENYDASGLRAIPLSHIAHALFLVGTQQEIRKAEDIIYQVESTVGEAKERLIYWYTTKHADPDELGALLDRIYRLMVTTGTGIEKKQQQPIPEPIPVPPPPPPEVALNQLQMGYLGQPYPPINVFDDGYYLNDRHIVDDFTADTQGGPPNQNRDNFLVDPKTGAIVMVVESDILPKMKELIRKLDIPQKMVQIEILLFEKKIFHEDNIGLSLLRIGSNATNTHRTAFDFNLPTDPIIGITTFLLSRKRTDSGIPAFDLIYQFLIAQQDITINSTPSVLAINQTTARIAIEDEISVNTGIFEIPATGSVALKNAFARARYGTKIEITPTIHMTQEPWSDVEEEENYVTLVTDIIFETIQPGDNPEQPDVTRRVVQNEVRIPDGQTVIIGGLRRKNIADSKESIPFLGELPGVGKLFSITTMVDDSTDMFICITPKIVVNPAEDLERLRCEEMARRPGDIPSFLCELVAAREAEKNRLLSGTMQLLFGPVPDRCIVPVGEYDGR